MTAADALRITLPAPSADQVVLDIEQQIKQAAAQGLTYVRIDDILPDAVSLHFTEAGFDVVIKRNERTLMDADSTISWACGSASGGTRKMYS